MNFDIDHNPQPEPKKKISRQKTIGQIASRIEKKEKEIAALRAKIARAENEVEKLKRELIELLQPSAENEA